jgi:hypothetical protein
MPLLTAVSLARKLQARLFGTVSVLWAARPFSAGPRFPWTFALAPHPSSGRCFFRFPSGSTEAGRQGGEEGQRQLEHLFYQLGFGARRPPP